MPNNAAAKDLAKQVAKWDSLSALEREQAAQAFQVSVPMLENMIKEGLRPEQLTLLNTTIPGFIDSTTTNYNPATSVATQFTGGTNLNQGINQGLINGYTGNILNNPVVGKTAPLQGIEDRATDITNTQGKAGLNELVDAQTTFGDVIAAGGMTGDLKSLLSLGKSMVASGGFTPELMGFINQASSQIMQYGEMTPEMRRVFNSAMKIVDAGGEGGALLPTEQIISFARDEAVARGQDQFNAAQRSAIQRGMTPGVVTGVGGNLAEFADQIGQSEAKALRDASLGAQEQRLQQFLASQGTAGQIASANAQQRAGVASGLGSLNGGALSYAGNYVNAGASMANNAVNVGADYFNTATNGMINSSKIFADREQNAFDNLFGVNQAVNQNVGFGSDLARSGIDDQMRGVSLLNSVNSSQNNDILGLLGLQSGIAQNGQNNALNATGQMINIGGMQMSAAQFYSQLSQMTQAQRAEILNQPGVLGQLLNSVAGGFGQSLGFGMGGMVAGGLSNWANPTRGGAASRLGGGGSTVPFSPGWSMGQPTLSGTPAIGDPSTWQNWTSHSDGSTLGSFF